MKVKDNPGCQGCPMLKVDTTYVKQNRTIQHIGVEQNFVPPQLGPSLRLVVAEAPGETESFEGKPLVGTAGKFFDSLARKAGIRRDDLSIINCINCRPPNNVFPTDAGGRKYISESDAAKAVNHCYEHHVRPVLQSRPWERINALGAHALNILTGKTEGIQKWRGSPLPLRGERNPRVVPTLHPSFIMQYGQGMIPAVISDLKKGTAQPPENYNLNPTIQDLIDFRFPKFTFDIETNMFTNQITMIGLCAQPYKVLVVPFRGAYIDEIKRIFREAHQIVGQNIIMFDLPHLDEVGVKLNPEAQIWDTVLMHHLISPDAPHDLEYIGSIFSNKPAWKHLSHEDKELYCARDVDVTDQAFRAMHPILASQNLLDLYKYTQVPLAKICHLMETTGIHTSGERAQAIRVKLLSEIKELEEVLPEGLKPYDKSIRVRQPAPKGTVGKSGKPVKFIHVPSSERVTPWSSPARVGVYLYETLGLPEQLHTKTKKVSTDKVAIERLINKSKDPEIKRILQALRKLRSLDELASSFVKGVKDEDGKDVAIKDGRVAPHFSPFGTNSGRLSSSGPNMQNQPPAARYIYVPSDPEWCIVEADFSQGENRLTAWYADDKQRLENLSKPGFSEHKLNASIFFDIPYNEVVKDNSQDAPYGRAKKLTHGINYGEGPRKIAMTLDLPEKDVREWLFKWKLANGPTVAFQERVSGQASKEGVLTNVFGRKRWFWTDRLYGESLSFLPQSTLADICFRGMIGLMYERIGWPVELALKVSPVLAPLPYPAKLLLQVHDSLVVECPKEMVKEVVQCLKAVMTQPHQAMGGFYVPAEFSVAAPGASWGETKPYKEVA